MPNTHVESIERATFAREARTGQNSQHNEHGMNGRSTSRSVLVLLPSMGLAHFVRIETEFTTTSERGSCLLLQVPRVRFMPACFELNA